MSLVTIDNVGEKAADNNGVRAVGVPNFGCGDCIVGEGVVEVSAIAPCAIQRVDCSRGRGRDAEVEVVRSAEDGVVSIERN